MLSLRLGTVVKWGSIAPTKMYKSSREDNYKPEPDRL